MINDFLPDEIVLFNVSLKILTEHDSSDFLHLVSVDDVRRNIEAFSNINDEYVARKFINVFKNAFDNQNGAMFGIRPLNMKKLIGIIGVCDFNSAPSVFYALHPEYRCKGIMVECVKWLTNYLHNKCHKDIVVTEVDDFNEPSKMVLLKCGFNKSDYTKLYYHKTNVDI